MQPYKEQLDRLRRWQRRIENETNRDQMEYEDFLWAFFQNCWHLKDWIKHDDALSQDLREKMVKAAEKCEPLKISADLANRSKHLKLYPKAESVNPNLRRHVIFQITENVTTNESSSSVAYEYLVVGEGEGGLNLNALAAARDAVRAWESILDFHGLDHSRQTKGLPDVATSPYSQKLRCAGAQMLTIRKARRS